MVGQQLAKTTQEKVPRFAELQRCAWEVGITLINPVLVAYGNGNITSNSLLRDDIRRLFPNDEFYGVELNVSDPTYAWSAVQQEQPDRPEVARIAARGRDLSDGERKTQGDFPGQIAARFEATDCGSSSIASQIDIIVREV